MPEYFPQDGSTYPLQVKKITVEDDVNPENANAAPEALAKRTDFLKALIETLQGDTYTRTEVDQLINDLINGAPDALNTLNELAAALNENDSELAALLAAINQRLTQAQADERYVQLVNQRNKNLLINGNFDIWQRGNSFTGGYTADRWAAEGVTTVDMNETGTPQGSNLNARIERNIAGTASIYQRIEAVNTVSIVGKKVTVSFYHGEENGSVDSIDITLSRPSTTADDFSSLTTIQVLNVVDTTTGVKTVTFDMLPAEANWGVELKLSYNISSAADWRLTRVQLESGDIMTSFEYLFINEEKTLCQRYYQKWDGIDVPTASIATGQFYATTSCNFLLPLSIEMRKTPSFIVSDTSHFQVVHSGTASNLSNLFSASHGTTRKLATLVGEGGGFVTGRAGYLRLDGTTGAFLAFDAEL